MRLPPLDRGELVAVDGGFQCRGCGRTVRLLYRGPAPTQARCARCLAGLPRPRPVAVQPRLPLG